MTLSHKLHNHRKLACDPHDIESRTPTVPRKATTMAKNSDDERRKGKEKEKRGRKQRKSDDERRYEESSSDESRDERRVDDDVDMASEERDAIASMLDSVRATQRQWTLHEGTSVCYHRGRCETCTRYVQHLAKEKKERNRSLMDTLEELERHWEDRVWASGKHKAQKQYAYDRGFEDGMAKARDDASSSGRGRGLSLETQPTPTSSTSSRTRASKGKHPMTDAEYALDEKTREFEELQRRYAKATAEITRLRRENDELNATLQSRAMERSYDDMYVDNADMYVDDANYPPAKTSSNPQGRQTSAKGPTTQPAGAGPSNLAGNQPIQGLATTYAAAAAEALKRKATAPAATTPAAKRS